MGSGGEEWPDEVTGFRGNRQDGRQMGTRQNQHHLHFATEPSLHERRVYRHSPVATSALGRPTYTDQGATLRRFAKTDGEVGMSDVSNSFTAWETLPEDEPPLCIAVRRPVSPHHYEAVNRCGATEDAGLINSARLDQQFGAVHTVNSIAASPNNRSLAEPCSFTTQRFVSSASKLSIVKRAAVAVGVAAVSCNQGTPCPFTVKKKSNNGSLSVEEVCVAACAQPNRSALRRLTNAESSLRNDCSANKI
ncbi:hypothetical protein RB195_008090 [Necator americanus]|uniref:Uncharacterized protein n=1 Tax=Necator americanus TaxID=51031 RepID=A0ABR1CM05_NECAM